MSEKTLRTQPHVKYVCKKCKKNFSCKFSLGSHWFSYHRYRNSRARVGNTNNSLICSRNRSEPMIHIKTLAGKKSYLCKICLVIFRQRYHLKSHEKIHEIRPCIYDMLNEDFHYKSSVKKDNYVSGFDRKVSFHNSHRQTLESKLKDSAGLSSLCFRDGHRKFMKTEKCARVKVDTPMCKVNSVADEKFNHGSSEIRKDGSKSRTVLHKCKMYRKIFMSTKFLRKKFFNFESKLRICNICKKDFKQVLNLLKHFKTAHGHIKICHCSIYRRSFHSFSYVSLHKAALCEKIESHYYGSSCKRYNMRNRIFGHKKQSQVSGKQDGTSEFIHKEKAQKVNCEVQNELISDCQDEKSGHENEIVPSELLDKPPVQDLTREDQVRVKFDNGHEEGTSESINNESVQEITHIQRKAGSESEKERGTSEVSKEEAVSEVSNEEAVSNVILEDHTRFTCEQRSERVMCAAIDKQVQNVIHQDQNVVASEQGNETYNQPLQDDTPQAKTGCENEWVTCENPFECPVQETKFDIQRKVALENPTDKWSYELPNRQPVQGVTHGGQDKVTSKYDNVGSSELANKQLQRGVFEDKSVMLPVQRYEVETHGLYNKHPVQDTSLNQGKVVLDHQNKQMSSEFPDRQIVQERFPEIQRKMAYSHGNERVQNEFPNKQPGQDAIFEYQRRIALGHGSNYQQSAEEVAQGVERTAPTGYMFVKENSSVNIDSNRMTGSDYHRGHAFQCKVCKHTFYQEHQYNKHMETYHKEGNEIAHKATSDNLINKSYGKAYNLADGVACFPPGTSLGKPAYGDFPVKGDQFSFNTMVYKCKYCNVVFGNCEAFQWHLFHAHSKNSFYECYICRTKYTDRGQFTNHIQSHTQRQMHTCSFCKEGLHICEIGFYSETYVNKLREACVYNEQNYNLLYNHELRYPTERAGNVGNQHPNSSVVCNVVGETESNYNQKQYNYGRYNLENNSQENYANSNMSQIHKGSLKASEDLRQLNMFSPETSAQRIHENVINVMFEEFVKVEENCFYSGQENFGYERRLFSVVNHNFAHENSHNPCGSGNIPGWTDNEMCNEEFTQVFDILYNTGQGSGSVIGKNETEFNIPLKKKRKTLKSERNNKEGKKRGRGQFSKQDPQNTEAGGPNPHESGDLSNENTTISYNARLYECNICHRKFQHDCNLHLHMKVHESRPDEKEDENEDEKEESQSDSLLGNLEDSSEENGIYSCKICKKQYTSAAELKQHKASHWESRLFFCNICKKDFRQYANLVRHKEGVHERLKPHSCSVCNKSFHTVSQLNIHRNAVHEKIRSYQCDTCPMRFSCKFNMLRHREKVHEKIKMDLVPPAAEPSKKKSVRRRRRKNEKEDLSENQHTHTCEAHHHNDGKDGTTEVCHSDHSKVAHEDEKGDTNEVEQTDNSQGHSQNGSEVSHSNSSKCTCKVVKEVKTKHRKPRSKKVVVKPYSCDLCKQNFKTLRILKKHMMILHETEGFPCNFCGKEYVSIVLLSKHERIHINKLYECSECRQKFHRKFLYDRHRKECCPNSIEIPDGEALNTDDLGKDGSNISSDTEETLEIEKSLSCNICSKRFAKSGSLQRHLLYAHPENKPFSCHICKREFAGKCHLILHKKSHTQRKSFDCVMCEKGIHICEEGFSSASHPKKYSGTSKNQKLSVDMSIDRDGYSQGEKTLEKGNQESNCSQGILEVNNEAPIPSKSESLSGESQLRQECFNKSPYVLLEKLKADMVTGKQQTEDEMCYACNLCSKRFERAHTLKRHLLYAHPKVKPFTCEICKRDFVARCHLIIHAKSHSLKVAHDCEMCQQQMHICEKGFHIGKEDQTSSDLEENCTSPYCQEHCIPSGAVGKTENQDTAILCNKGTIQDKQLPVVIDKPDNVYGCLEVVLGNTALKEEKECSDHNDLEFQGETRTDVDPNSCEMSCLECNRVFENNALYMQHLPCKGMVTKHEDGNQEIHQYYQDDLMKSETGNKGICDNPLAKLPKRKPTLESSENHDKSMVTNSSERMDIPGNQESKNLLIGPREICKSNENFVNRGCNKSNSISAIPFALSVENLITTSTGASSKHDKNMRPKCHAMLSEIKSTAAKDYLEKSSIKDWKTDNTFKIPNYKLSLGKRTENSLTVKLINKNVDQTTLNCSNSSEDSFNNERNDAVTSADETQNNIGREQQKIPVEKVTGEYDSKSKTSEKTPLASEGDCVKNVHLTMTGITENSGENSNSFSIQGSDHCQTSVPCEKNESHLANKEHVGRGDSTRGFEKKVSCISEFQVVDKWMKL